MYPIINQFTDTATTDEKIFNYSSEQDYLSITNNGNTDLIFEVGKYNRVVLHPAQTWANDVDFYYFKIKSFKIDCSFDCTIKDYGNTPASISQLTDIVKQTGVVLSQTKYRLLTQSDITNVRTTSFINKYGFFIGLRNVGTPQYGGWILFNSSITNLSFDFLLNRQLSGNLNHWFILGGDTSAVIAMNLLTGGLYKFQSNGTFTSLSGGSNLSSDQIRPGDTVFVEKVNNVLVFRKKKYGTDSISNWFTIDKSALPTITEWSTHSFGFYSDDLDDGANAKFGANLAKNIRVIDSAMSDTELLKMVADTQNVSVVLKNSKWNGKRILFFGDSLTAYNSYLPVTAGMLGLFPNNHAVGGKKVLDIYNYINAFDLVSNFDMVVIFVGINDYFQTTTVGTYSDTTNATYCGTWKTLMDLVVTKFPTIPVAFITFNRGIGDTTRPQYVDPIIKYANDYGYPTLDLYRNSGINVTNVGNFTAPDKCHFNSAGADKLGYQIAKFLDNIG